LERALERPGRRAEAARALQKVLPPEEFDRRVFPKIVAFLRDTEDRDEASTFLWVVRGMGPRARKAGPVVVKHLRALEKEVLETLVAIQTSDPICVEAVRKLLDSPHEDVRRKAEAALRSMTKSAR